MDNSFHVTTEGQKTCLDHPSMVERMESSVVQAASEKEFVKKIIYCIIIVILYNLL